MTKPEHAPKAENEAGQPSPKRMMEALRKSGYLFEHEVAIAVERMGFYVERSHAYVDPDEGKSREVDIRAFKMVLNNKTFKFQVCVHMFIECKDSDSPFVFLQTDKSEIDKEAVEGMEYLFPWQTNKSANAMMMRHYGLQHEHYYYKEPKKSVQFAKIVRKGSDWFALHENVYDALILPQVKAVKEFMKGFGMVHSRPYEHESIQLYFNAIVVRDHLFMLDLDRDDAEPQPAGRASFQRQIEMRSVKGKYLVDFVTQSYLETYVQNEVLGFANEIVRQFGEDPMRFRSHGANEKRPNTDGPDPGENWRPGRISLG
ncbi:hypothetical protein [Variovorax paradoxus]|nr:hypothetical protein [Variovorax paradoxus]